MEDELTYGEVKVIKGKHKGRIGYYDDDKGEKSAYVYWGDIVSTPDACDIIRKSYLSNDITTYDLVERIKFLKNEITYLRTEQQFEYSKIETYKEITELYGEYVVALNLLNKIYVDTFYLNGNGEKTIFISHSSANRQESLYIASDLKEADYNVWFDVWDLKLGHSIPREISDGLEKADVLLIILSKDYLESAFCNDEWEAFYMHTMSRKPIITIILDESEPPVILKSRKYYRLNNINEYDLMIRELKDSLNHM